MALTNTRPLQIPALQSEILHNTASPVFQASSLVFNPKHDDTNQLSSLNAIPNTPSSESSPSLHESYGSKGKKDSKDNSIPKRDSPSLEISKIVPVTGERPMPSDRTSPLDDDVLHAVFVILWEKDPEAQGMTVKQLSDYLLEKHPEMNNLSTKLSNLISAKLNAYVKKLEKGEKTLTYALSREWSNSSPRRMVYVYRGILSSDYKKHAQAAAVQLKQQQQSTGSKNNGRIEPNAHMKKSFSNASDVSLSGFKNNNSILGATTNLGFSLSPEFNIPYSTSPVSAILTPNSGNDNPVSNESDSSKKRSQTDGSKTVKDLSNGPVAKKVKHNDLTPGTQINRGTTNNTGNIISNNSANSTNYITVAAAAPRRSKFSSKNEFKTNSQNSANIVAAIHKAISTQTPIEKSGNQIGHGSSLIVSGNRNDVGGFITDSWVKSIREGFLIHDIGSPESLSFEDLEYTFD